MTWEYGLLGVTGEDGSVGFSTISEVTAPDAVSALNEAGAAGWELVHVMPQNDQLASVSDNYLLFFKRELP